MLRELIRYWRERWELQRRIAEELRFHTEEAVAEKMAVGMTRDEAERAVRARLGHRHFITQQCLAAAGLDNIRLSVVPKRIPTPAWGVAAVIVPVLLAAVLIPHHFQPLPVAAADQLAVSERSHDRAFAIANDAPETAAAFRHVVAHVGEQDGAHAYIGRAVSSNFFELQNAAPALGPGFSDSGEPEMILSYELWEEVLDLDRGVIGRWLEVNGEPYRIAGVMPQQYWFLDRIDRFWLRSPAHRGRRGRGALLVAVDPGTRQAEVLEEFYNGRIGLLTLEDVARRSVHVARGIVGAALALLMLLGVLQTASLLKALGDEQAPGQQVPFGTLLRNYAFLFAKALPALVTAAILWIASVEGELLSPTSYFGGVSIVMGTFVFALAAVAAAWYSLIDQRLRCPMCLRKLSMPVPFGIIGSILFDLPGTEYICAFGHGTLYVPEPTSEGLCEPRWKEPADVWAEMLGSSPARLG